ncbi:hypothetical protein C8T65DRAFT_658527 [Cerioporus squamosus]|nr:hypothetical protein C8T65DRAFT_658527 [Cerioporus squamosus]
MAQPVIYSTPPLAGRPPFATDEPDHIYAQQQQDPSRRLRQPPPQDLNGRSSAYNMYDQYLDEKENPFDDSKQMNPQPKIPLAAPQPGYAAPVAALNLARPSPAATPDGRMNASPEMSEYGGGMASQGGIPNAPHPLQAPMTPIAPVFARPSTATSRDVKFASTPIMRGETEDTVLPRRGQRGDDFWRRFSMVAKEEMAAPQKQSMWLRKTQNGTTRMSRWVWIIGLTLLIIIAGAIGLGWYVSHNSTTHSAPTAIGGSANEKAIASASDSAAAAGGTSTSVPFHVTPTNTVARRALEPIPTPQALYPISARGDSSHRVHIVQTHHRGRRSSPVNRTSH